MKIYRTKLSEVKKLLKEDTFEDEEMDRQMEEEPLDPNIPADIAEAIIQKIRDIMVNLSIQMHDMSEGDINTIINVLDRKLGEKIVTMMY